MRLQTLERLVEGRLRINELNVEIEILQDMANQLCDDPCAVTVYLQVHNKCRHDSNTRMTRQLTNGFRMQEQLQPIKPCTTCIQIEYTGFSESSGLRMLDLMIAERKKERAILMQNCETELRTNKFFEDAER